VRLGTATLGLLLAAGASPLHGAEIPDVVLVLEASAGTPGAEKTGAPIRFALLKDGRVFVGGTSAIEAGQLDKREARTLRRRAEGLTRLAGFSETLALAGDASRTTRLRLLEGRRFDLSVTGDPDAARGALAPVAAFISDLMGFDHPSLRPFAATRYVLGVRQATLQGGCRSWSFPVPLGAALSGRDTVPAAETEGWPSGALPSSVCLGDRRYVVTLRPLLPGEQP
jgi:hypothetical protein